MFYDDIVNEVGEIMQNKGHFNNMADTATLNDLERRNVCPKIYTQRAFKLIFASEINLKARCV